MTYSTLGRPGSSNSTSHGSWGAEGEGGGVAGGAGGFGRRGRGCRGRPRAQGASAAPLRQCGCGCVSGQGQRAWRAPRAPRHQPRLPRSWGGCWARSGGAPCTAPCGSPAACAGARPWPSTWRAANPAAPTRRGRESEVGCAVEELTRRRAQPPCRAAGCETVPGTRNVRVPSMARCAAPATRGRDDEGCDARPAASPGLLPLADGWNQLESRLRAH